MPRFPDIVYSRELTYGNAGVVPEGADVCLGQGTMVMRADSDVLLDRFLLWSLNSPIVREQAANAAQGAAHPHVNLRDIKNFAVPTPPLTEQRRIVRQLDELKARTDVLVRLQAESAAELDALLPSILDKAFKGEL